MVDFDRSTALGRGVAGALILGWIVVACGGPQKIHHYQPEVLTETIKARSTRTAPDLILAVEDFSAGAAYDEQRMVYRASQYRFDYYHFHRWSAPPGMVVGETLRSVYRETGAFRAVVSAYATRADVVLSGRVLALEEVDVSNKKWLGNVVLDLRLRDAATGELLWSSTVQKQKPLPKQSPKGLTRAVSAALTEIGVESVDEIVRYARKAVRQRRRREESQSKSGSSSNKATKEPGEKPTPTPETTE